MKVAQLTYSARPSSAVTRLSLTLRKLGVDSDIIAIHASEGLSARLVRRSFLRKVKNRLQYIREKHDVDSNYPQHSDMYFSTGDFGVSENQLLKMLLGYDVINLHWINGMLSYELIRKICELGKPVFWTMHDCWAYSGGCHHGCENYENSCGTCPVLGSHSADDLSRKNFHHKQELWGDKEIIPISPSHWMHNRVQRSALFKGKRAFCVGNGIDLDVFNPKRKHRQFGSDKYNLLVGADSPVSSPYKGFSSTVEVMKIIAETKPELAQRIRLIFFGSKCAPEVVRSYFSDCYEVQVLGYISNQEELASVYADTDLFLATSIYDNLPTTLIESLACGTPVAAFDTGGISDIVQHQRNGYLAPRLDAQEMAAGIDWILANNVDNVLGENGRRYAEENFADTLMAENYMKLYEQALQGQIKLGS